MISSFHKEMKVYIFKDILLVVHYNHPYYESMALFGKFIMFSRTLFFMKSQFQQSYVA